MTVGPSRYDVSQLDAYWQQVSARHATASENGLELICYAGMPQWFNSFMDRYQVQVVRRLMKGDSFAGSRVLDVGTGVGRWARRYARVPGCHVTGIDLEAERLQRAREIGGEITYRQMSVDGLDFPDESFDVINCVTVLQHVPHDVKLEAIAEIARVSAPTARVVLLELTDTGDDAPHVFPWPADEWERAFAAHGFGVARHAGNEYIPLLRGIKRIHRATSGGNRAGIDAVKQGRRTLADRARLAALRSIVVASYPLEEAMTRLAPPSCARINGWLFRRGA